MKDKFNSFFQTWNGKPCEVSDPSNLNQCFDLAFAWCDALSVPRTAIGHLYASQIWTNPNDATIKYFEMIPNTPLGIPQVGDIVVFKGGTAGHVSISTGVGDTNTLQTFDQNWGATVGHCGLITHVYDNVLGFLRLRVPCETVITDQTKLPITDENGNQMEVQAVRSRLSDWGSQLRNKQNQIDSLTLSLTGLNNQITDLEGQLATCEANSVPSDSSGVLQQIKSVFYGPGWWWTKWAKIKALLPK